MSVNAETFMQLRDLFDRLKQVHYDAAECCRRNKNCRDKRVDLLADYFREQQQKLGEMLAPTENHQQTKLLNTWVQFVPMRQVTGRLGRLRRASHEAPQRIVEHALDLQDAIASLFWQLSDGLDSPDAAEMLADLGRAEASALHELGFQEVMQRDA